MRSGTWRLPAPPRPEALLGSLLAAVAAVLLFAVAAVAAPGGGRVAASSAGQNIGDAGVLTSSASTSGVFVIGGTDWWVIYPETPGSAVVVNVANNAAAGCDVDATLDGTGGADQELTNVLPGGGTTAQLAGRASGSDRYYVAISEDGCGTVPYTLSLVSGGGGTPPDPASGSAPAGTSIGNAWPPLRGHVSYGEGLGSPSVTSQDWYLLYKNPDSRRATIRVENTGTCLFHFELLNGEANNANPTAVVNLDPDGAATFGVPGSESADPRGRYYLAVSNDGGCSGGEPYLIEPEPSAEWQSPARVRGAHVAPARSAAVAWPPLNGAAVYGQTLAGWGAVNWFVLYKKRDAAGATIRFADTGNCFLDATLFAATASGGVGQQRGFVSSNTNGVITFTVTGSESDPQGRYYLEVTEPDPCAAAAYTIEAEPGSQWAAPALKVPVTILKKATLRRPYSTAIAVFEGRKPYTFTAKSKLPPGLRLGRTGTVSGTPAKVGTYSFTALITDSSRPHKSVTITFSLTVAK